MDSNEGETFTSTEMSDFFSVYCNHHDGELGTRVDKEVLMALFRKAGQE